MAELRGETQPVALDLPIGRLSRMDAMQQQAMASGQRGRVELELVKARQALRRLDDGTFGSCLRCQDAIAYERLSIHPVRRSVSPVRARLNRSSLVVSWDDARTMWYRI